MQPTVGEDGQDVINRQVDGYDIFVGIMWKKYGFPTSRANSATDEEYTHAYKSYKENGHCKDIIMLFCTRPVPIDVDANQLSLVQQFKKRVASDGIFYKEFTSKEDFCTIFRIALYKRIIALLENPTKNFYGKSKKKVLVPSITPLDDNTKLVFDTLVNSPAINDMKSKFIESYILLFLYKKEKASATEIVSYLKETLCVQDGNLFNGVLGKLNNSECLDSDKSIPKNFYLSNNKRKEIGTLKRIADQSNDRLIQYCKETCDKYDIVVDSVALTNFVCKLFEVRFSSEINEWSRIAIKSEDTLKSVYHDLISYLQSSTHLPSEFVSPIANEIVEIFSKDPMVYKTNTSRMFLSLFQNNRLDEFLASNRRDLILDTQILLQICCVAFDANEPTSADILYKIGKRFWNIVKDNKSVNMHTTVDYIEEVASQVVIAYKLSRFLDLDFIKDLGPSKNVFFNHYLMIKDDFEFMSFDEYVCELLDVSESELECTNLQDIAYRSLYGIFEDLGIHIISIPDVDDYAKFRKEYETTMDFNGYRNRTFYARQADIHAALLAGNFWNDFGNTPYLLTTDTSFVGIRDRFDKKFEEISYWYVYSPQKMSEALQLSQFKVDPAMIDDNIISLTESNFNTSNDTISFIDLLNIFVDKKQLSDWKLAAKLSRIRKLRKIKVNESSISINNQPIDEFLNLLTESYINRTEGYKFADLKALFIDNNVADVIADYIQGQMDTFKQGKNILDENNLKFFDGLIESREANAK